MAGEKYDPYQGFTRIAAAVETLNKEAIEVVTLHFALEREIERVLSTKLTRTDKLGRLNFGQKAAVLHSCWQGSGSEADNLYNVLDCFSDLRNGFAHNDLKKIDACRKNLMVAYRSIDPTATEPFTYGGIAQGLCAFLGDGMMPDEFKRAAESLSKIVNVILPSLGGKTTSDK